MDASIYYENQDKQELISLLIDKELERMSELVETVLSDEIEDEIKVWLDNNIETEFANLNDEDVYTIKSFVISYILRNIKIKIGGY